MADAKISALNELVTAANGDLLAIVDDPTGAAETKKITAANFLDSLRAGGQIYTYDGVGTQTLTLADTWYLVTQWDNNGYGVNTTPDQANNKITLTTTGYYLLSYQVAFSGSANSRYGLSTRLDGVQQNRARTTRVIGATGDVGSCSAMGIIDVTAVPVDLELWVRSPSGANRTFNVVNSQLVVHKIAST